MNAFPSSQPSRIAATLDSVSTDGRSFTLALPDGEIVHGTIVREEIESIAEHVGSEVLVLGYAHFDETGQFLRIDAKEFVAACESDRFFACVPKPRLQSFADEESHRQPQTSTTGVNAIWGKWPGDETDEELRALLKEIE